MCSIQYRKCPTGTIDLIGESYKQIKNYIRNLEDIFESYEGEGIETPMYEIRENLMEKYADDNNLVFNLEQTSSDTSELYTLRYDLTVPKIRHVISNSITKARLYSCGKVFRRDTPSAGRLREFYQGDFDIYGENSESMLNEFMLLKIADEFIRTNNLGIYKIYINSTQNLNKIICDNVGIDISLFKTICSSIDKLDKVEYDKIIPELKNKGLTDNQIELLNKELLNNEPICITTQDNIKKIKEYSKSFGFNENIIWKNTLARGLDYYNGIIFEIKLDKFNQTVIAGGRYDGFGVSSAIGISFGLSRILDLINKEENKNKKTIVKKEITIWKNQYLITSMNNIDIKEKLEYTSKLEKILKTNISFDSNIKDKKLVKVIQYCLNNGIKYLLILAPNELANNNVIIKDLELSTQTTINLNENNEQ